MTNEVFQWIAIASLLAFTAAVYIRLGSLVVGAQGPEEAVARFGASEGEVLPQEFLDLLPCGSASKSLLLWTSSTCQACTGVLDELEMSLAETDGSVAIGLIASGAPEYVKELHQRFPGARISEAESVLVADSIKPPGTPIWMTVTSSGSIARKGLGYEAGEIAYAVGEKASTPT